MRSQSCYRYAARRWERHRVGREAGLVWRELEVWRASERGCGYEDEHVSVLEPGAEPEVGLEVVIGTGHGVAGRRWRIGTELEAEGVDSAWEGVQAEPEGAEVPHALEGQAERAVGEGRALWASCNQ